MSKFLYSVFIQRDIESYYSYNDHISTLETEKDAIEYANNIFNISAFGFIKHSILVRKTQWQETHPFDDFISVKVCEHQIGNNEKEWIFEKDFTRYQWDIQDKINQRYGELE